MIKQDRAVVGTWVTLADPSIVELAGLAGHDFAVIDMEHTSLVRDAIDRAAAAARRLGKPLGCPIFHPAFNRDYQQLVELGVRFITYSTDAVVLLKAWRDNLNKVRKAQ